MTSSTRSTFRSRKAYDEKYHDNCHDYLKPRLIQNHVPVKYRPLLEQIRTKIPKLNICGDTPEKDYPKTIVCDQRAVVLTQWLDTNPNIATYALNACIGLIFYCPVYRTGMIAHIDGLPGYSQQSANEDGVNINFSPVQINIDTILRLYRSLMKPYPGPDEIVYVDYYLIGGIFDLSEVMIHDIIQTLQNINQDPDSRWSFRLAGRNLLGPDNQSRNICLDTRTGNITYFDYELNSQIHQHNRRNDGLPINVIKAPQKSTAFLDITYIGSQDPISCKMN